MLLFALLACAPHNVKYPGDSGADADVDADTDADADADADTSLGLLFRAGEVQTRDGSFVAGHFGYLITDLSLVPVCTDYAEWSQTAEAAPDCPQCVWAFNLRLSNGVLDGPGCVGTALHGDEWDGLTASWGFADTYEYDYNGTVYSIDAAVMLYYTSTYGWATFGYPGAGYSYVSGAAEDVSFRQWDGYAYYSF